MADGIRSAARPEIIWIGQAAPKVAKALSNRGLTVRSLGLQAAVTGNKSAARAVIVPISQNLRQDLAALFLPVLDSGAALFVILPDKKRNHEDLASANYAIGTLKKHDVTGQREQRQPIKVLPGWLAEDFAEACARHNPGPAENTQLFIAVQGGNAGGLPQSHQKLLGRAFSEFERIQLTPQTGGFSKARVWKVEAFRPGGHSCEPFVAKVGEWNKITSEIQNIVDFVESYVPFSHFAPLVPEKCLIGATDALIVSMFVDRAQRMDEFLRGGGGSSPVITSLFEGALRRWRSNRQAVTNVQFGSLYRTFGIIPTVQDAQTQLGEAYQLARRIRNNVRPPDEIIQALHQIPRLDMELVYSHGDLHIKNIYVKRTNIDVVLIDFAQAGQLSPLVRDPSTLDVSLAFDEIDGLGQFTDEVLRQIYSNPLEPLPPALAGIDGRTEAMNQVRLQGMAGGAARLYELSIACHLLRLCRFADRGDRRSLAYEIADRLIGQ